MAATLRSAERRMAELTKSLAEAETRAEQLPGNIATIRGFHRRIVQLKRLLPKPGETSLLTKTLVLGLEGDYRTQFQQYKQDQRMRWRFETDAETARGPTAQMLSDAEGAYVEIAARGAGWSVGTSLIHELVVLAVAALIFSRRDY